jgi:hypothetical protein
LWVVERIADSPAGAFVIYRRIAHDQARSASPRRERLE